MNPLLIYLGLLLGLLGVLTLRAGIKDRRIVIAVSGFLFVVAGAGLIFFSALTAA